MQVTFFISRLKQSFKAISPKFSPRFCNSLAALTENEEDAGQHPDLDGCESLCLGGVGGHVVEDVDEDEEEGDEEGHPPGHDVGGDEEADPGDDHEETGGKVVGDHVGHHVAL